MTDEQPDLIQIPREDLRAIFDLAVSSLNFGSGFWDQEDTDAARTIAIALGIDPMEATPANIRSNYPHKFAPRAPKWNTLLQWDKGCGVCGKTRDHECHGEAAALDPESPDHDARSGLFFAPADPGGPDADPSAWVQIPPDLIATDAFECGRCGRPLPMAGIVEILHDCETGEVIPA